MKIFFICLIFINLSCKSERLKKHLGSNVDKITKKPLASAVIIVHNKNNKNPNNSFKNTQKIATSLQTSADKQNINVKVSAVKDANAMVSIIKKIPPGTKTTVIALKNKPSASKPSASKAAAAKPAAAKAAAGTHNTPTKSPPHSSDKTIGIIVGVLVPLLGGAAFGLKKFSEQSKGSSYETEEDSRVNDARNDESLLRNKMEVSLQDHMQPPGVGDGFSAESPVEGGSLQGVNSHLRSLEHSDNISLMASHENPESDVTATVTRYDNERLKKEVIPKGESIYGQMQELSWTHNMPEETFLELIEGNKVDTFNLQGSGSRGLQFRHGIDSQYGGVTFVTKSDFLKTSSDLSKFSRDLGHEKGQTQQGAYIQNIFTKEEFSETEHSGDKSLEESLKHEALKTEFRHLQVQKVNPDAKDFGDLTDAEGYWYNKGHGCGMKFILVLPSWCNYQLHSYQPVEMIDIAAIILPKHVYNQNSAAMEALEKKGCKIIQIDVPKDSYYSYRRNKDSLYEVLEGSTAQAIEDGMMRNFSGYGNSSSVALSKKAFKEVEKNYYEHIVSEGNEIFLHFKITAKSVQ